MRRRSPAVRVPTLRIMPPTMSALRKQDPAPGLALDLDAPIPSLGPTDVRIAVRYAGICGTDRHIYEWDSWGAARVPVGIVVGHEFCGTVDAVGAAVTHVEVGQRVSGEGHIGCGRCQPCRTGNGHICERVDIIGIDRDGCFAEYVVIPESNVWPVHASIPDRCAGLMDPIGNAMHTVMAAGVSGRSVLITGAGVIGLLAVAIARAAGAGTIIAVDVSSSRLDLARIFGADVTLDASEESWPDEARRLTSGQGPEVVLEMSGHPNAIRQGFAALRNGGTAALLGLPSDPVALDLPNDIVFKGATVLGINGRRMFETWYQVEAFLLSGRLRVDPLITHVLPLESYDLAFKHLAEGEALKVLLEVGR
jgi:threonine 3-dehydrogenase